MSVFYDHTYGNICLN